MGDGLGELPDIDRVRPAVGGEGGKTVAGEVGGGEEALEVVRVEMRWICGDRDWWVWPFCCFGLIWVRGIWS